MLDSLPSGPYRVRFHVPLHTLDLDEQTPWVEIRPGETARVELPLNNLADVELEVLRRDGTPHAGRIAVDVARYEDDLQASSFYVLLAPPYVLQGFTPGVYQVSMFEPFVSDQQTFQVAVADPAAERIRVPIAER